VPGILPIGLLTEPGEQPVDQHLLDERFDYIALGHIHQAQQVSANAWYAGSTERFGWNDVTAVPGYNLVEFGPAGEAPAVTRVEGEARPMIALRPVSGEGREGREIADAVLRQLQALARPDALARVELRDTARPVRREVQALLRREAGAHVWHVDLAPERSVFVPHEEGGAFDEGPLDLHALFREFVAVRKPDYRSEAFATAFLERGSQALTDALLADEAPAPEDDAVS
jgi:DNA repair exonuclease SbcCD nuclease subunit